VAALTEGPATRRLTGSGGSRIRLHLFSSSIFSASRVNVRTLLHRWVLEEGLGQPCRLLLHVDKAPELIDEPVIEGQRSDQSSTLEGIEPQIDQDWPVDLPPSRPTSLAAESISGIIVVDADGPEPSFRRSEDLVPLEGPLPVSTSIWL